MINRLKGVKWRNHEIDKNTCKEVEDGGVDPEVVPAFGWFDLENLALVGLGERLPAEIAGNAVDCGLRSEMDVLVSDDDLEGNVGTVLSSL